MWWTEFIAWIGAEIFGVVAGNKIEEMPQKKFYRLLIILIMLCCIIQSAKA